MKALFALAAISLASAAAFAWSPHDGGMPPWVHQDNDDQQVEYRGCIEGQVKTTITYIGSPHQGGLTKTRWICRDNKWHRIF